MEKQSISGIDIAVETVDGTTERHYNTMNILGNEVICERTITDGEFVDVIYYNKNTLEDQESLGRITPDKKTELESVITTLA